jgi:sec-independent protein translocase protein TatA
MLEGWEWLIIGAVIIVIIMWGPAKIPQFAKAIGRAKGEYNKASKESEAEAAAAAATVPNVTAPATSTTVIKSRDEVLVETAAKMGISTDGKTREEIAEEISVKAKLLGSSN